MTLMNLRKTLRRTFAVRIAFLVWGFVATQQSPLSAEDAPVLKMPAAVVPLHVAVPLPDGATAAPQAGWQLVEIDNTDLTVPVQLANGPQADGTSTTTQRLLIATIPPRKDAPPQRRFRLQPTQTAPKPAFQFKPENEISLRLSQGKKPILTYNHGIVTDESVPAKDSRRSRACYIHPVWGLDGEIMTGDFPKDHYHHHGIFWAWPYVGVGGKDYDMWEYRNIQPKFVKWLHRAAGAEAAVLAVENGWFVGQKKIMIERLWIRVHKALDDQRSIDLHFTWIPVDEPVSLRGRGTKSYGGLTMRFDVHPRRDGVVTTERGTVHHVGNSMASKTDLVNAELPWADLTSRFPDSKGKSGASVFIAPTHPNYPPSWLTRCYGCLCVGWPGVKAQTFLPGKPIRASYRIWVHKSALDAERGNQAYAGFAAATRATWERKTP
uniref:Hypothetical secreted protein n=1 Tax=uncultured planctomycete 3FN TaxID=455066 RepID=A9LGV6_9BACT|nr:hypothetical secreted protein [uncultured planctomycete 3FN]